VRLCVVGDGPLRGHYLRRLPEELQGSVQFAGRVDWNRPRYYASADVLCSPCLKASFGMVLLEAMSCALPIVASRISGFELLVEHGREGLLVEPPDEPAAFAAGIERMLDAPAERKRMGAEGRHTAVNRYAWHRVAGELAAFYAELRGDHQPGDARPVPQGRAVTTTTSPVRSTRVPS
jgi:glycosyltransferase involved in cell wall biosynthesis